MASCDEYRIKITLLAEGGAGNPDAALDAHLRKCPDCRAALEETKMLLNIMSDDILPEPSPEFTRKLAENSYTAWAGQRKISKVRVIRFRRLAGAAAAAAAVLIIALAGTFLNHRQNAQIIERAAIQTVLPEDIVLATFTDTSLISVLPKIDQTDIYDSFQTTETQPGTDDIAWVESQISRMIPSSIKDDLFYTIESLSEDEANQLLESLGVADTKADG